MTALAPTVGEWNWVLALSTRVVVGGMFTLSGAGKLFVAAKRQQMVETVRKAGLPAPPLTAAALSLVELLGGVMVMLGFRTSLATALLAGLMVGALVTTDLHGITSTSPLEWLGQVLFLPQLLTLLLLLWLLVEGAGPASVDGRFVTAGPPTRRAAVVFCERIAGSSGCPRNPDVPAVVT